MLDHLSSSLVPNQTPEAIDKLVNRFIEFEFAKLCSKNKLSVENLHGGKPWVTDPDHWNYVAASKATQVRQRLPCLLPSSFLPRRV